MVAAWSSSAVGSAYSVASVEGVLIGRGFEGVDVVVDAIRIEFEG